MRTWDQLPSLVRDGLVSELGALSGRTERASAANVGAEYAGVLSFSEVGRVMIKATSRPDAKADFDTEVAVAAILPDSVYAPRLLREIQTGSWRCLVFDAIEGLTPTSPIKTPIANAVVSSVTHNSLACRGLSASGLISIQDRMAGRVKFWRDAFVNSELIGALESFGVHGDWAKRNIGQLGELEEAWPSAVSGDTLLQFDPRPENFLVDDTLRAWITNWRRTCVGASWVDLATLLPVMAYDGVDADRMLFRHPDGSYVIRDQINSHLAAMAGFWVLATSQGPSDISGRRNYRRKSATGALMWLRKRLSV